MTASALRVLLFGFVLWSASAPSPAQEAAPPSASGTIRAVLLHTNDVHGQIRPLPDPRSRDGHPRMVGGYQELVFAIDEERSAVAYSFLVDAGDWFQGTPEGTLSNGRCSIELMNAAGYDAAVVGNHEFDAGPQAFLELLRLARFPVFARNLRVIPDRIVPLPVREAVAALSPGTTFRVGPVPVRIDGLLSEESPRIVAPKLLDGFDVLPEVEAARAARAAVPAGDPLVLVNHVGKDRNVIIARDVPGIDVIIGGHVHRDVLEEGVRVPSTGTLIAQAAATTQALGVVTLEIDPAARRIVGKTARLRRIQPVEGLVVPRIAAISERYEREVAEKMDVPVCEVPVALLKDGDLERGSTLGAWLTRAMILRSGADVAVHNQGGIRASLPAGRARVREFFQISPFGNLLTTVTLRGRDLKELAAITARNPSRGCVFGGLSIHYSKDDAGVVQIDSLRQGQRILGDDDEVRVVTTDYLAGGADHMSPFGRATGRVDLDCTLLDATIDVARDARSVVVPEGSANVWVRLPPR